ncbi:MAG: AAA family ATPase [Methylobacteriaceae bacterium]|nr:AAA family ATPase [Methylobacteriaceae bacterium]
MFIGDILIAHGLVTKADIAAALDRQKIEGGRLGDNLIALGKLKAADLEAVMHGVPAAPRTIADTGLGLAELLNLLTKVMYSGNAETASAIAGVMKLPHRIVQLLIEQAQERKFLNVLGAAGSYAVSELRYALTEKGKQWALDALGQNQYIGPAPVSLAAYQSRIMHQRITNERVDRGAVDAAFAKLVISESFVREIGPAINSGRSILLYGPPGNGKTSVAERIGGIYADVIYIPYCFDVEGQIIKVFDPGIHKTAQPSSESTIKKSAVRREDLDPRWIPCRRPFIVTGGELTLEMLDLSFNTQAKFYEAPLHVKALGGTFVIDDFGRQIVSPEALLNRWIVPLESRVEYLKLHTGKSFSIPFDELVIFSTNLAPRDLMDPAFLRRIPYKLEIKGPSPQEYRQIFRAVSKALGLEASDEVIDFVIAALRVHNDFPLASYQPKFIVDQVLATCKFEGIPAQFKPEFLVTALGNLHTKDTPGFGVRSGSAQVAAA